MFQIHTIKSLDEEFPLHTFVFTPLTGGSSLYCNTMHDHGPINISTPLCNPKNKRMVQAQLATVLVLKHKRPKGKMGKSKRSYVSCPLCPNNTTLGTGKALYAHLKLEHSKEYKKNPSLYICQICKYAAKKASTWYYHKKSHSSQLKKSKNKE